MKCLIARLAAAALSGSLALGVLGAPAEATPGQTEAQMQTWIKTHGFFVGGPYPDPARPGIWGVARPLSRKRSIFLEIWLEYPGKVMAEELSVSVPKDDPDPLDLYDRLNPSALRLLELVYGPAVAEDFKTSKLVWDGFKYYDGDHRKRGTKRVSTPLRRACFAGKQHGYLASYVPAGFPGGSATESTWEISVMKPSMLLGLSKDLEGERKFAFSKLSPAAQQAEKARLDKVRQETLPRRALPSDLEETPEF